MASLKQEASGLDASRALNIGVDISPNTGLVIVIPTYGWTLGH